MRPGPWQTPPPRQQATDTLFFPAAIRRGSTTQYAVADPVTFGGAWADLLNPPISYGGSAFAEIFIEHAYDPTGYLGQPVDTWEINQWVIDVIPTLQYPFPAPWSPPLPWPAHAVDWEYDFSANTTGVYPIASEDLKVNVVLHAHDNPVDYTAGNAITSDLIINPVDPATLTLDTGTQLPLKQNVRQSDLLATPVIGRGNCPFGGSVDITSSQVDAATWIASLDLVHGDEAVIRFTVNYDNLRTGTEPAQNTFRRIVFDSIDVISDWQPPRWRFLFDTPVRLRQHPRDDALGGTPRQSHQSRSVQASARQGWTGTYR